MRGTRSIETIRCGVTRLTLTLSCVLLAAWSATPAYDNPQEYLEIPFIDVEPLLEDFADMKLPDHLQGRMAKVENFIQREPNDGATPSFPTEVYVAYDHKRLYAIFVAFDDEPEKLRANMAPRGDVFNDDSVNIMIDTFNDQRRAYFFLTTPRGVQADGQFIEGSGFDGSFEAVWDSEARLTDRGFIVRIAVPFSSIRFPKTDEQTWRVIFNRMIPRLSEDNFWPQYSIAIEGRLNQTAIMTGIRDISPGRNIQLVPFGFFRDFRNEKGSVNGTEVDDDNEEAVGLDAKMVLADALVLDLTANPDFSQVESDQPQVTVNERFEVFFPELRPFFLENSDLFRTPTNLLFTRRIADPSAGAKLTGKQGAWTIATLFADDEAPGKEADRGQPLHDERALVGVARISRDISAQSKLGFMLTDRELKDGYNRVGAVDGRFKLNDNVVAEFQVAAAGTRELVESDTTPGTYFYENHDGVSYNAFVNTTTTHLSTHTHYLYTSPGFRTQLGFLNGSMQRPDSQNLHHNTSYRFRPKDSKINEWGPSLGLARVLDSSGHGLDWSVEPEMVWSWLGNTRFQVSYEHDRVRLLPEEYPELMQAQDYSQNAWQLDFDTQRWTRVGFGVEVGAGTRINFVPPDPPLGQGPELADFRQAGANLLWRPIPPLRLDVSIVRTDLENRNASGRIFTNTIGRLRANWQFTRELSLRMITDYQETDAVPGETSLTDDEEIVFDVLVKYLWNPWKAFYVGYTSDRRDFLDEDPSGPGFVELEDRGEQVFVKFSYLFQI